MVPADHCLESDQTIVRVKLWLVVQFHFPVLDGMTKVAFERDPVSGR